MGRVNNAQYLKQVDQILDNYARGKLTYIEALKILTKDLHVSTKNAGDYLDMEEI